MAKFSVKNKVRIIVKGASQSVIPNPQGIPMVVNTPAKLAELEPGVNVVTDQEVIDRIRKDIRFGTPDGIFEITAEDDEAMEIKAKKLREADDEIKARRGRPKKDA